MKNSETVFIWVLVCFEENKSESLNISKFNINYLLISLVFKLINEPHREKTCLCHMQTTKAQNSLRIHAVWLAPLFFAA